MNRTICNLPVTYLSQCIVQLFYFNVFDEMLSYRRLNTLSSYNEWQLQVSSATSSPYFRLARKVVCSTMATYNKWHFIILSISVQTRKGWVAACAIRNLCCASVLSNSQAVRRSESLASARHNQERERVFYGQLSRSAHFQSEQSPRTTKLYQFIYARSNDQALRQTEI